MKKISTSALAKSYSMSSKIVFDRLQQEGLIKREQEAWQITDAGFAIGAEYQNSAKFGTYIVWPESIKIDSHSAADTSNPSDKFITAKIIAAHFEVSANKINFILSELGWLKKGIKGWLATQPGLKLGAIQAEDKKSGIPFVRWPETILSKKSLVESIEQVKGKSSQSDTETDLSDNQTNSSNGFREKFEAKHRSADGHFVRSKAEMLIDNWLYMAEIVHAYERKLPIEEDVYCDFYIPTGKVYIEYWGYENEQKYLARKQKKIDLYNKYGFNLIQLKDEDVQNLDDILPRLLLKFGVQAY